MTLKLCSYVIYFDCCTIVWSIGASCSYDGRTKNVFWEQDHLHPFLRHNLHLWANVVINSVFYSSTNDCPTCSLKASVSIRRCAGQKVHCRSWPHTILVERGICVHYAASKSIAPFLLRKQLRELGSTSIEPRKRHKVVESGCSA